MVILTAVLDKSCMTQESVLRKSITTPPNGLNTFKRYRLRGPCKLLSALNQQQKVCVFGVGADVKRAQGRRQNLLKKDGCEYQ